jgi:hypothetical protein
VCVTASLIPCYFYFPVTCSLGRVFIVWLVLLVPCFRNSRSCPVFCQPFTYRGPCHRTDTFTFLFVTTCFVYSSILKMDKVPWFETCGNFYQAARHHITRKGILYQKIIMALSHLCLRDKGYFRSPVNLYNISFLVCAPVTFKLLPLWKCGTYQTHRMTTKLSSFHSVIQWNLYSYKAEPHGTENIFHTGQISALYKINNTDSSGRDYRICSHW